MESYNAVFSVYLRQYEVGSLEKQPQKEGIIERSLRGARIRETWNFTFAKLKSSDNACWRFWRWISSYVEIFWCLIYLGVYISVFLINNASGTPLILLPSRVFARTACIHNLTPPFLLLYKFIWMLQNLHFFNYQRKMNLYFFIRTGFYVISFATNILLIYIITPFLKILIITGYTKLKTNVAFLPIMPVEVKFGDPHMTAGHRRRLAELKFAVWPSGCCRGGIT